MKSAVASNRSTASAAEGDRKSIATLRLPELSDRNNTDWSPRRSVPWTRYGIAARRDLQLDHVGAEGRQERGRLRPGDEPRQVDHSEAVQRRYHGSGSRNSPNTLRNASDSSPSVAPARAASTSTGMTLRPSRAAASTAAIASEHAAPSRARTRGRGARDLSLDDAGVEDERLGELHRNLVGVRMHVHPDARPCAVADGRVRSGRPIRRSIAAGRRARWRRPHPPARRSRSSTSFGARLELVGEVLDEVGAGEWVGGARDAGLERDDLLGAQRQRHGLLRRDLEGLVVAHDVDRLRAAEHRAQALHGGRGSTLFSGCCAVSVVPEFPEKNRSRPEFASFAPKRSVAIRYHMRRAARSFATSSNRSMRGGEVEGQPRRERVERHPARDQRLRVRDRGRERERELLDRVASGLARVVAGDRDRVEPRQVLDANSITSHDSRIDGSGGKTYVLRARNSFRMSFCSVPASALRRHTLSLGRDEVHRQDDRRRWR